MPVLFSIVKGGIQVNKLSKFRLCGEVNSTISGKLLYLILLEICNQNGEIIIPQRRISEALRVSKGTVSRNLLRLRDAGYIDIFPTHHSDGGRAANKYRIR